MISEQQKPIDSGFGAKSEPTEVLKDIDLGGKVAMVTGGYSGIGLETTRALKEAGARVLVPARRKDVAASELSGIVDSEDILDLDLADPSSAQSFVDGFIDSGMSLDILINNAAVMACPQMPTKEGWDLQFAVNHIGHFIITEGLLPALMKSAEARIVTLSSTGHKLSGIQWDDVHFENIFLPDSTTNFNASNGFLKYTIKQQPDLPEGTVIKNDVGIYFDYNEVVMTNETFHTIGYDFIVLSEQTPIIEAARINIYPNPFDDYTFFKMNSYFTDSGTFELFDLAGKLILQQSFNGNEFLFHRDNLLSGNYFYKITDNKNGMINSGQLSIH